MIGLLARIREWWLSSFHNQSHAESIQTSCGPTLPSTNQQLYIYLYCDNLSLLRLILNRIWS